jgi:signal transduction histidine kinase
MISIWRSQKLLPRVLLQVLPATVVILLVLSVVAYNNVNDAALVKHQTRLRPIAAQSSIVIAAALQDVVNTAKTLAANDLVVNSVIDTSDRDRYIPMLFQSLRVAKSERARITLADYRGRRIASNTSDIDYKGASWITAVMGGREVIRITANGMIVAVPVSYAGQPEGMIIIALDRSGLADILTLLITADAYNISTIDGDIIFTRHDLFTASGNRLTADRAGDDWVRAGAAIAGFPKLRLVLADTRETVFALLEREKLFYLSAILFCIAAVGTGIVVTALIVVRPIRQFIAGVEKVRESADFAYRVDAAGPEEFQRLARSFNMMLSEIETTTTSRDYVDGILNSMNEFMLAVSPDGKVDSGNRALARALGCRRRDLPGREITSFVSGDFGELIALADLADDELSTIERRLVIPNGIDLPVQISAARMQITDTITGRRTDENSGKLIILLKDISDEVRAKATIDSHIAELQRSNADLEQFAYVASHDLKAPLRAIDNLAGWIEEDVTELMSDDSREHMHLLRSRINRLEALLEGLLQYARSGREKAEVTSVECSALIAGVIDMLVPPDSLQINIADDLPDLMTTHPPLQQVFHNLIGNAIKHHDRVDGVIDVTGRDLGTHFEFTVRDDGPGIPKEYHEKIFQMFQTLKRRDEVEGSGIGLAVVQKLVRAYGGTITVLSNADERGSAFCFTWKKHEELMEERNAA